MDERLYWLGFANAPLIGPKRFSNLLAFFETPENIWNAPASALRESGLGPKITGMFLDFRKQFSPEAYYAKMQAKGVDFIAKIDTAYPQRLLHIPNPPNVLFMKGTFNFNQEHYLPIAIVGTRKITEYGRSVTRHITADLVSAQSVIISGLAMGVDAVAHRTTLENNGTTIAVLGCGVDCCSPRENIALYNTILEQNGVIISEAPLSMMPAIGSFPSRNRIIAGLSDGVLVTEGAEDSGSLITAENALTYGRKVFAVPGPIDSSVSKGPLRLIKAGAQLVTSANDILESFAMQQQAMRPSRQIRTGDTQEEQIILDLLAMQTLHFNELAKQSGKDVTALGALLTIMEMKGMIKSMDAGMFRIED